MLSVEKPMSLVEVKKQQWAREREEMSRFYMPWGSDRQYNNDGFQIRNQFASTLELHKQSSYEYQEHIPHRQRSPSLPPIRVNVDDNDTRRRDALNRNIPSEKRFAFYDEDGEGDTSGYGSETFNHMSKRIHHQSHGTINETSNQHNPVVAWQNNVGGNRLKKGGSDRSTPPEVPWSSLSSRQGGSGGEEGRLRWGDRGVATGRLWEPQEPTARLPQMQIQKKGTPAWVERGLNMMNNSADVLLIDQQSNHSGVEFDRSSFNGSDGGKNTFLRGQNVPIEPEVKAQRETKRMKALELQSAILNQLEEREKQRREERERKLKEERLEELRIQRQQEEDRHKLCEERRRNEEKRETEQRKMEALRKAIEDAEKKAKLDKEKLFSSHKYTTENKVCAETISQISHANVETPDKNSDNSLKSMSKQDSPRKSFSNRTYDVSSPNVTENQNIDISSSTTTDVHTPRSATTGNINLYLHGISSLSDPQVNLVPIGVNPDLISPIANTQNGYQLAVLVPHGNKGTFYNISQPISLQSINSIVQIDDTSQNGKLLTPRKYRSLKIRDASTQTDSYLQITNNAKITTDTDTNTHNIDKNYQNIDENAPQEVHNKSQKERRYRSEERFNKNDIENRPKWGVNRPAAQYKKQSEKDPFYSQKRKIRQKHRPQPRQYLSHSSDDSRSPSPPTHSETLNENHMKSRLSLSQSHWRNKRQDIFKPSNISVETINITPLECNHLGQVIMGEDITENQQTMPIINHKISPSKRTTLSQKFINDKYGNRKLWNDESLNSKSIILDLETGRDRKSIIDRINTAKRDTTESGDDQDNVVFLRSRFQK